MKEVTAYLCEYCGKMYKHKSSVKAHEKKCFGNLTTRSCRTCKHAIKDSDTIYVPPHDDQNYGDADYEQDFIYCDAINDKYLMHYEKPCGFETNCSKWSLGEKLF
ncbi:hypothetical protein FDC35_13170 [Clostridium botulinum]|nr:hypothetical protein [Clostridium botulinum]NFH70125.1 hypothetical protein [Clostridium botulinum]NFP01803.1 hypothetical protein [Clostridium botulinum]